MCVCVCVCGCVCMGVNMQHVRLALQEFLHNKAMILAGGV